MYLELFNDLHPDENQHITFLLHLKKMLIQCEESVSKIIYEPEAYQLAKQISKMYIKTILDDTEFNKDELINDP